MGLDLDAILDMPLGYSQSNGTIPLRESLAAVYPGATPDHIEVTNGTSEANYLLALALIRPGRRGRVRSAELHAVRRRAAKPGRDGAALPPAHRARLGAGLGRVRARRESRRRGWSISRIRITRSGSVLSHDAMRRIVDRCEEVGAYLLADEVYLGAEIHCERTRSFWGMSDRVIVTSGLSKAYGIPGVRIGWIVGPSDVVADCWTQHDYLTIGPNKISDIVARVAVENREKLYARTRAILQHNLPIMREWARGSAAS